MRKIESAAKCSFGEILNVIFCQQACQVSDSVDDLLVFVAQKLVYVGQLSVSVCVCGQAGRQADGVSQLVRQLLRQPGSLADSQAVTQVIRQPDRQVGRRSDR